MNLKPLSRLALFLGCSLPLSAAVVQSARSGIWSDARTWQGEVVPAEGDEVVIGAGHEVIYDVKRPDVIRSIRVAGVLKFVTVRDTELNVGNIRVQPGPAPDGKAGVEDVSHDHAVAPSAGEAALLVGEPGSPVRRGISARIRLHFLEGMNPEESPAIVARPGGRMEFHGSPMSRTWVKLDADADVGAGELILTEEVTGWSVGDEVIVTAGYDRGGEGSVTEERRVVKIDGKRLHLDKPLESAHPGTGEFRSEVANLSRNVIVESADPDGERGHTMYHRFSKGSISYARFAELGKEGVLGRYPIHFHLVRDSMRGSSVVGAAIVNSRNRWVTVHGTYYLLVRDCVGYRSTGHGFFMEDATEVYNLWDRNLAVGATHGPRIKDQALPFDPNDGAGFWWANGRNSLTRNVSCGNGEYGFRFDIQKRSNFDPVLPVRQGDGTLKEVDVRTIPVWRFDGNEAHSEGLYGLVIAANGNDQPDSPVRDEKQLEHIKRLDWTGPDRRHPHRVTNMKIWSAHYAFRPHSPNMLMEGVRIHHTTYGIYRPAFDNQVYRDVHLSELGPEPFNRGMDDTSAQWGTITVDGLLLEDMGRGDGHHPVVHMTDNNLSGRAACHFRKVTVKGGDVGRPIFNRGGSSRSDRVTPEGVPYFLHDHFGPGRTARLVALATERAERSRPDRTREEPPMIGEDVVVEEAGEVSFPQLLEPVDDEPPATAILSVVREDDGIQVRGVSHDNGEIVKVLVNGKEAELVRSTPGVVDWSIRTGAVGEVTAAAIDEAGNEERTVHRLQLVEEQASEAQSEEGFVPLFPEDGVPAGWVVRQWSDVGKPAENETTWTVKDGILHGSPSRGTWLMSEREFGNFELRFEFKLGPTGNGGCALRAPMHGDPAFDGLELQMADLRYNPEAQPSELTGGFYRAAAPKKDTYFPEQWNEYRIVLHGSQAQVWLNNQRIQNIDLEEFEEAVKRHDGSDAPPLKSRPRKGHLGFQELSRGEERVMIRNARIKVME